MPNDVDAIAHMVLATLLHVVLPENVLAVLGCATTQERSTQEEDLTYSTEGKPISLLVPVGMRNGLIRKIHNTTFVLVFAVLRHLLTGFDR